MNRKVFLALLQVLSVLFVSGCQTYKKESSKAYEHWNNGEIGLAVQEFGKRAEKNDGTKDHIVWHLEHATVLRADNNIEQSQTAFEAAETKIDEYESEAKISLSREAGATLSNQANLPYRGRAYDKIMMNTYRALNYWEMGEFERARHEILKAYQRQQDAVEENKKAIEQAQEEERQNKEADKIEKAREDEKLVAALDEVQGSLEHLKPYGDYVNPFTVFLDGLFFSYHGVDASDMERSRQSFEQLMSFVPENTYVESEMELLNQKNKGKSDEAFTYVVFETGSAPSRDQIRIDIPIIISKVSYVGAAFPRLKFHDDYFNKLTVMTTSQQAYDTQLIASMDNIVGNSFKKELPIIISKTIVSTIVKATAAYAVNEGADQAGAIFGLVSKIGTAVTQAAINIADLRTWITLPKEFQYCRLPTPDDGVLVLETPDGIQRVNLNLNHRSSNFIYVRSINTKSPLIVNQFSLNHTLQNETQLF